MTKARKIMVVATLLLAALSSYADLPRLNTLTNIGDTLNVIRVLDPIQHTRMLSRLGQLDGDAASTLQSDLDDGMKSLQLLDNTSVIQAVVPERFELPRLTTPQADRISLGEVSGGQLLTAIPGALLTLDLPPPRFETHLQPPRLDMPLRTLGTQSARAPPLALR